jgi:hypothetical protein
MKTRRRGSSRPWYFFHCARRRATSARSCSVANSVFFEAHPRGMHDPPHRAVARHHAARAQLHNQRPQRHVRCRRQSGQQPRPLRCQRVSPTPAHRLRRSTPRRTGPLRPLHYARHADLEPSGNLPAALTIQDRPNNSFPKIQRISSYHPCWPPTPASILNQKLTALGIPYRFRPIESDSRPHSPHAIVGICRIPIGPAYRT